MEPSNTVFKEAKHRIKSWVTAFLGGHHDHYASCMPDRNGMSSILYPLLTSLFSNVSVNSSQANLLRELHDKGGIIIYVTKYKNDFEYLFYHFRYKRGGLPSPQLAFEHKIVLWQSVPRLARIVLSHIDYFLTYKAFPDPYASGFIANQLISGTVGLLSLVDKRGFHQRFVEARKDPLTYLIELQRETAKPIYLIPQWLFFGKKPRTAPFSMSEVVFGSAENPGRLRRWATMLNNPQKAFVEISEPLNLQEFLEASAKEQRSTEQLSFSLRKCLLDRMNRHHQSITGPPLKTREELKERILRNERFQTFLSRHQQSQDADMMELHRKAEECLDEIAADYSPTAIHFVTILFGWIWRTIFDGVVLDMEGLNRVKTAAPKAPLVFVPCHKSHFDYLILSYLLSINNMPCPHVAAGKNLAFWPMGPIFRKVGAFFIRRSFHGARLYSRIFAEYVYTLIEEGFNLEFFIEGGRSRTGKMVPPKTGLLTLLMEACKNGASEDLIFVPVYIGYDQLLEESALVSELQGASKEDENVWQLLRARKIFQKRHGRIYVQFSETISLSQLIQESGHTGLATMNSRQYQQVGQRLAHRIVNGINRISVVTPRGLAACAILNYQKRHFTLRELMVHVETYLKHLRFQNVHLSENLSDLRSATRRTLALYCNQRIIDRVRIKGQDNPRLGEQRFVVPESKRLNLEYYKNNCIHFFVPAAYCAIAILSYDSFQFSVSTLHVDYEFLDDFFQFEFTTEVEKGTALSVEEVLNAFVDDSILMPHPSFPGTYNITSSGLKKLLLFARFLKTYLESYWVVLNVLNGYSRKKLVKKECRKRIRALGNQMYRQGEIERCEALSAITYENGLDLFNSKGIRGNEDDKLLSFYSQTIRKYLNCCHMMQK